MKRKQAQSKKVGQHKTSPTAARQKFPNSNRRSVLSIAAVLLLICGFGAIVWVVKESRKNPTLTSGTPEAAYVPKLKGTLTFNKEIAPIIFQNCAVCHRPGQAAPFALLSYAAVKKHAQEICDVIARRYMPPWPPEPGYGHFANERRLTAEQIGRIRQWVEEGTKEGDSGDLPATPQWTEAWQLGRPDLVVQLPEAYLLPAEGKDVYRNFVVPIPVSSLRYVKGVEFQPGNPKVVHHAFIQIDETRQSRRLAEKQNPPGFDGMDLPESAIMPGGQLLGWQPGKRPSMVSDGLSWVLKPKTDLVLQMHMHPTGKPEPVRPAVAFYFSDQAPTHVPFRIKLARFDFEIPAGASNFVVEQSYELPVDVKLSRVLPHAHYLGKDLQGYAMLPNGQKEWLIRIKDWDFNWQGDYQYAEPVSLLKGSKLVMHYTYDNSSNNVHNPNSPPRNVQQGLQTTDEMAGLVFQALVRTPEERAILAKDYFEYFVQVSMDSYLYRIARNPNDGQAQMKLGRALLSKGQTAAAMEHLLAAVKINPLEDKAHYELGYAWLVQNRAAEAYQEFQTVIRLNPDDYQAFGNLGLICLAERRLTEARTYLETALRLNPDDPIAQRNLARLNALK